MIKKLIFSASALFAVAVVIVFGLSAFKASPQNSDSNNIREKENINIDEFVWTYVGGDPTSPSSFQFQGSTPIPGSLCSGSDTLCAIVAPSQSPTDPETSLPEIDETLEDLIQQAMATKEANPAAGIYLKEE